MTRSSFPADIPYPALTVLVDPREKKPLDMHPLKSEPFTLDAGDYSEKSLLEILRIERKADDLLSCCGTERRAFMDQMQRLRGFPVKALVLEYSWPQIEAGQWQSKITPASVLGTLLGLVEQGIPVIACGSRERAGQFVAKLIYITANRRYRQARGLIDNVLESREATA